MPVNVFMKKEHICQNEEFSDVKIEQKKRPRLDIRKKRVGRNRIRTLTNAI